MANKVETIVKKMVEKSGKADTQICAELGKDETYITGVCSGSRISPYALADIASLCGFRVLVTDGEDSYEVSTTIRPREEAHYEPTGEFHECEYTSKFVAFTGSFFGLDDWSQKAICAELGASWKKEIRKKEGDVLVVGDLSAYGGTSAQLKKAQRWGKEIVSAEEFKAYAEKVLGRAIG